jgi:hypothetical protein
MLHYNESVVMLKKIFKDVKCVRFDDLVKTQDIGHSFFNLIGIDTTDLPAAGIVRPSLSILETQTKIFASRYIESAKKNEEFIGWMKSPEISDTIRQSFCGDKYDLWQDHDSRIIFYRSRMKDLDELGRTIGYGDVNIFHEPDSTYDQVPAIPPSLSQLIMDYFNL